MKKNPIVLIFLITFVLLGKCSAQDPKNSYIFIPEYSFGLNLYSPSNEFYLFSAYDEGANAFRYNPAVLGLRHRFNFSLGLFLERNNRKVKFGEGDLMLNSGNFGASYRIAEDYGSNAILHKLSLGLGFGNKTISGGLLLEYSILDYASTPSDFQTYSPRINAGFGILFRPNQMISTAFTMRYKDALSQYSIMSGKYSLGTAIRPMKNGVLTLLFDGGIVAYENQSLFKRNFYKAGVDVQILDGVHINANYMRINDKTKIDFINVGLSFNGPHASLRNNNVVGKILEFQGSGAYDDDGYDYRGTNAVFLYSTERKESIMTERKGILEISLSGSLQDYHTEDVFFGILGEGKRSIHEVIGDIDYAAKDESVKGIIMKIYPMSSGRFEINAGVEELTNAMTRFRNTGKHITAYFPEDAGPGEYYIATFTDEIVLPEEAILFYGLSIEVFNYRQFLEKYGIELQTFYAGKYKLTFQGLLDSTTEEGKVVINRVLDIAYEKMLKRVSEGRNLTVDEYLKTKLSQPLNGREAKRLGLVDANGWYDDAKDIAEKNAKLKGNFVKRINRSKWDEGWGEPEEIAIIGVYGSITSGESEAPSPIRLPIPFISGGRSTGSETVVRQLEDAFSNPRVKAVILRVDSGGGSALASAEINDAIIRLKKKYKKLFVVSMGGAAASGGYYVSTSADKIFADDLTITGSIGVFTARPNLDSLVKGQKIKVETFKRGDNSDIGSLFKHLDEQEIEIIQGLIDYYYDNFIESVAKGRNMSKEEAENAAQGRVWLGTDAFNKRLVDEIGGLYEAINYVKKESKVDKRFKLVYYAVPGGETISEIVTNSVLKYFAKNLEKMFGFGDDDGIEIKY